MSKSRAPEEIVVDLAPAYHEWKGGEKTKNKLKTEFFDAITKYLKENGEQAEDLIYIFAKSPDEATELAQKQHPGWVIEDWRDHPTEPGAYEIIIKEDPQFQPFTIEHDGYIWGRQVAEGSTMLDDERLQVDNPDLWKSVTAYPYQNLLEDIAYEAGMDPRDVEFEEDGFKGFDGYIEWQCEKHGLKRSLKPMDELDEELLAQLKEYTYIGSPTIKLPSPKKVKE